VNDDHVIQRCQWPRLCSQAREQPREAALDGCGVGVATAEVVGLQHQGGRR